MCFTLCFTLCPSVHSRVVGGNYDVIEVVKLAVSSFNFVNARLSLKYFINKNLFSQNSFKTYYNKNKKNNNNNASANADTCLNFCFMLVRETYLFSLIFLIYSFVI